ncbi:hypothetical protein RF11_08816 [Thelohanellus kitauei]|uniref:Cytochrome c oxidase subunit 5A, mitochondrial n=1 Tax=Thelohanellus kitauei TaxID=669202 RepID=A0A0C2MHY1_THEKT|nr:hypothetical protein RF11_08816 [Thelohanellus kitauei]
MHIFRRVLGLRGRIIPLGQRRTYEISTDPLDGQVYHEYFTKALRKRPDKYQFHALISIFFKSDHSPPPEILAEMLLCCHHNHDLPIAIRIMEEVRQRMCTQPGAFEYIEKVIEPTMKEIGLPTLKELGL